MNKTQIEWALNPDGTSGYTWNPITGCLNGCEYCYARKLANTRLKKVYQANLNHDPNMQYNDPFYPRFWEDRLLDLRPNRGAEYTDSVNRAIGQEGRAKRKGIFVCDMSDLFGIGVPEEWTKRILDEIYVNGVTATGEEHRFYLLTKQPQNLQKFGPFPDTAWVGVTATDSEKMYWAVSGLEKIQAQVKYLSFEPLLDWKSPKDWLVSSMPDYLSWAGIKWVIIGAQTKPYRPPRIEWVKEIVEACDKAGIPVFLKNNLAGLLTHRDTRWAFSQDEDIPQLLKLRQEIRCDK